jgi:outer membrane protein assembly factor BamB
MQGRAIVTAWLLLCGGLSTANADNWPLWRGARHDGISLEKGLPVKWSKTENVAWRLPLPDRAGATPVVWDDRIFLTTPAEDHDTLLLMCISTAGRILWQKELDKGNRLARGEGNSASPSPCTDGRHVWAFLGTGMLGCYDIDGNEVWRFNVQKRYGRFNIQFGMTSTPVLDGDRLYLQLIHGDGDANTAEAIVVCLDKTTGDEIWKQPRLSEAYAENEHSYASPTLYRDSTKAYLLTHGADYIIAHSLDDGRELWRSAGLQPDNYNPTLRLVASPVAVPGLIVAPSAKDGRVIALNPDGAGDITNTKYKLWEYSPTPDVPSPLVHDGLVYLFKESSTITCVDAKSGEIQYKDQRIASSPDTRASPMLADSNLYLAARNGTVAVVKAGRTFETVAVNKMDEQILASPVPANGRIYIRTNAALWAIGK